MSRPGNRVNLTRAIAAATTYPFNQNVIDRNFRGDYVNLFAIIDLTIPRLKGSMFLGTRWGQEHAKLVPAPGDPWYLDYTREPLAAPLAPPPGIVGDTAPSPDVPPNPDAVRPANDPVLPVAPPSTAVPVTVPGPDGLTAMFPGTDQASTSNSAPTQTEAGR